MMSAVLFDFLSQDICPGRFVTGLLCLGLKRLSVPLSCLHIIEAIRIAHCGNFEGISINIYAPVFIVHLSICFLLSHFGSLAIKTPERGLPFLLRCNLSSVGFGSDVL